MDAHPTIISAAALLKRKWPTCRRWTRQQLINFLGFFNEKRQLGVVIDEGRCVGVGIVRILKDEKDANDPSITDNDGHIAWVEIVATTKPTAVHSLFLGMMRFCKQNAPNVRLIGGRHTPTGAHRLSDFNRYFNLLMNRRICYGW